MRLPDANRERLLEEMNRFDSELRGTPDWADWEQNQTHKYAIQYEGRLYPVKQIIHMATGAPLPAFSGGDQANNYVRDRDFEVIPLREEPARGIADHIGKLIAMVSVLVRHSGALISSPSYWRLLRLSEGFVSHPARLVPLRVH